MSEAPVIIGLPLVLLAISLAWIGLLPTPAAGSPRATFSFAALQLFWVGLYVLADASVRSRWLRFVLAGVAGFYLAYLLLDAFLLTTTAFSLAESLRMIGTGGDFLATLVETGTSPSRFAAVLATGAAAFLAGGFLQAWEPRRAVGRRGRIALAAGLPLLVLGVSAEQYVARERCYVVRERIYPLYRCAFLPDTQSQVLHPVPPDPERRVAALDDIGPPGQPRDVVVLLLESVRADVLQPDLAPNLSSVAAESLRFRNAFAEAIWTVLAWRVLLLDEPSHMWIRWPRDSESPVWQMGSWPVAVFHRAGYRTALAFGSQLQWKRFHELLAGDGRHVDHLLLPPPVDPRRDHASGLAEHDRSAVEHVKTWIRETPADERLFLLVQLGSTHWPYDFEREAAWTTPYASDAQVSDPFHVASAEGLSELRVRYVNSVHFVDSLVGEVLDALRAAGRAEQAVIAVVSDHGEGFELGRAAHASLHEGSKRVPMFLRLPGLAARDVDALTAQSDLYPTLFDYLEIPGLDPSLHLGRSALPGRPPRSAVVTMGGASQLADLTLEEGIVRFQVKHDGRRRQRWTPVDVFGPGEAPPENRAEALEKIPWQPALRRWIERADGGS